ncbi:MAG: type II toxin-antitoxin system VapC family toxin [Defluviitaleaceae bacterium]|nr:type II toxin-antitoxin system VapC family toxin [Defluviitaleaceae bacterium]
MTYLLDTNVCVFLLNGKNQSVIERYRITPFDDMALPSIVVAELLYGAQKSARREDNLVKFRKFIHQFRIADLTFPAIEIYGEIRAELERKGTIIGPNDFFYSRNSQSTQCYTRDQ